MDPRSRRGTRREDGRKAHRRAVEAARALRGGPLWRTREGWARSPRRPRPRPLQGEEEVGPGAPLSKAPVLQPGWGGRARSWPWPGRSAPARWHGPGAEERRGFRIWRGLLPARVARSRRRGDRGGPAGPAPKRPSPAHGPQRRWKQRPRVRSGGGGMPRGGRQGARGRWGRLPPARGPSARRREAAPPRPRSPTAPPRSPRRRPRGPLRVASPRRVGPRRRGARGRPPPDLRRLPRRPGPSVQQRLPGAHPGIHPGPAGAAPGSRGPALPEGRGSRVRAGEAGTDGA